MSVNKNNYCLILAGGKGRRLWPCSREDRPKQFLDFFSTGRTLLQQTYDRMAGFIPSGKYLYQYKPHLSRPGEGAAARAARGAYPQ